MRVQKQAAGGCVGGVGLRRMSARLIAAAAIAAAASSASGSAYNFTATGGIWGTSANWTLSGGSTHVVPGNGDDAMLGGFGTGTQIVNMNLTYVSPGLNSLTINDTVPGTYSVNQAIVGTAMIATNEYIGTTIYGNTYNQSAGANNMTGNLFLGTMSNSNSQGAYLLSGSGGLTAQYEEVGGSASTSAGGNLLSQSGGTNNCAQVVVGIGPTGVGAFNFSAGSLSASEIYVGPTSNASGNVVNQSGSATANVQAILVGASEGGTGTGTYTLSGGTINLGSTGSLAIGAFVGTSGNAIFNQSGGSVVFAYQATLSLGAGGTSNYFLSGSGSMSAAYNEDIGAGGLGIFTQTGGNNSLAAISTFMIGDAGTGIYNLMSGNLTAPAAANIGYNSVGVFNISGGTFNNSGQVSVGPMGTINITGGLMNLASGSPAVAVSGGGTVTVSAGAMIASGGQLLVGANGTGTATVYLSGTGQINGVSLSIGSTTGVPGAFDQTGGTLLATSESIGSAATAFYYQGAGVNNASSGITVGGGAFPSSYTVGGGTTNCSSISIGSSGQLFLSSGALYTGALNVNSTPSRFSWTNGTLGFTAGVSFDPQSGPTTSGFAFGSSLTLNSGMTLSVAGTESIGGTGPFTLTLNTGSVDTGGGAIDVAGTGTLIQNGGSITSTIINGGTFYYQGGSFGGQLNNLGSAYFYASGTIPGGMFNNGTVWPIPLGQTLTVNGTGLSNGGTFSLGGGTVIAATNNGGLVTGYGSIAGSIVNTGVIAQSGGNLSLQAGSGGVSNSGTINLATGLTLYILGTGGLINDGSINLDSGTLTGTGLLTNNADGTVSGPGSIQGVFFSSGTLYVPNGTTQAGTFTNNGVVEMADGAAELKGGTLTNNTTVEGFGKISDTVTNSGTIEAIGGTLIFTGAVTNPAGGNIRTDTNCKVLMQGTGNFPTNAGLITLAGGTFDNGGQTLINTGQIDGYGVLSTGGLTNNGFITFTGGSTTVNGPVINSVGQTINIEYQPALFTGAINNSGTIKTTFTTVIFAGSYIGKQYISDPSTNIFESSVTIVAGGQMTGGAGDQYHMSGGTFLNQGTFTNGGLLQSSDATTNSGTFTQTGTQNWSPGTVFTNTAGTAAFGSDAGAGGQNLIVNVTGGTVAFTSTQHLAALNISASTTATLTGGGTGRRSVLFTPSLSILGTLDLTSNDLDLQAGGTAGLAALTSLAKSGYNSAGWTGAGITSDSAAATDSRHLTAVGVILNAAYASLDGAAVAINDVLAKETFYGDTNLDGKVDGTDYSRIDNGALLHLTGWYNGDFNYDGVINGSDYTLIDNAFDTQGAQLAAAIAAPTAQIAGSSAVPEPATLGLTAMGAALLLGRRGRRRS